MNRSKPIFLSYRSVEVEFALRLAADLKNAGVNLWIDRLDIKPGEDWSSALRRAIDDSAALIAVITPEYTSSKYCLRELSRADQLGRPIFPVLLRSVTPTDYPLEIQRNQYIDFTQWRDNTIYQEQLAKLVGILKQQTADQVNEIPDPETRYLTSLIADLEARAGVMEYVELSAQADEELGRPRPPGSERLALSRGFTLLEDVPADDSTAPQQREVSLTNIREVVDKYTRFVLVGAPGAGKTTTLLYLVLDAAHAHQALPKKMPIPLLLKLPAWGDEATPADFVRANWTLPGDPIDLLISGKIVLFLDGLSEMGAARARKAKMLRNWLHSDESPPLVIVTSREADYMSELNLGLPVVRAAEMDDERIRQFVTKYLGESTSGALLERLLPEDERAHEEARPLTQLARNPFLLNILILIHKNSPDGSLPRNMGALLKHMAAELWQREQAWQTSDAVSYEEMEVAFAGLAFAMFDQNMPVYVPLDYALQYLGEERLLRFGVSANFLEVAGDQVRFSHQLIQEYFAAIGLFHEGLPTRLKRPQFDPQGNRIPTKWDKVLIALSGIVDDADAAVRNIAEVDPYLALECVASGIAVSKITRRQTIARLLDLMNEELERGSDGRVGAAKVLVALHHEAAAPILLKTLRDGSWEVRLSAHHVLKEIKATPLPGLVTALREWDRDIREATATALRQLGESAVPVLLELLRDDQWAMRRGAAWALGEVRDLAAVPGLVEALHDTDNLVRTEVAAALGWIHDPAAVPWLLEALRDGNWRVCRAVTEALAWIGTPALPGLLEALRDDSSDVRRLAVQSLGKMDDRAVVPGLLQALGDSSVEVRAAAVEALQSVGDESVVEGLIERLSDTAKAKWSKKRICDLAAKILEAIGTPRAMAAVERWRQDETAKQASEKGDEMATGHPPKKSAAQVKERLQNLKKQGSYTNILPDLLKQLRSSEWTERLNAVEALGQMRDSALLPELLERLGDDDSHVRIAVVRALEKLDGESAMPGLLQALGDDDYLVSDAAADALERLGAAAVPGLLGAVRGENVNARAAAIEALKSIGDASAVPALIACLADEEKPWLSDNRICDIAALALTAIGTSQAIEAVERWRMSISQRAAQERQPAEVTTPAKASGTKDALSPADSGQGQGEILAQLLAKLRSDEWEIQQDAAKALREFARASRGVKDQTALRRLTDCLNDANWVIRWAAAEALAWIGDSNAVAPLLGKVADPVWMVRVAVIRALLEIKDPKAAQGLVGSLTDEHQLVREAAVEAMGQLGDATAVRALEERLFDNETFVRLATVTALRRIGGKAAVTVLLTALEDRDYQVRWMAAGALGELGDAAAVQHLIRHLNDVEGPHWETRRVCDVAAEALECIGTDEARDAVAQWRQNML